MTTLLKELSSLEVEPLQVVVDAPESEQEHSLDTLTTTPGEIVGRLTGTLPTNDCCCCCFFW